MSKTTSKTTKITVISYVAANGIELHSVRVNDVAAYTPFLNVQNARAAAFVEACKASLSGAVIVEEVYRQQL